MARCTRHQFATSLNTCYRPYRASSKPNTAACLRLLGTGATGPSAGVYLIGDLGGLIACTASCLSSTSSSSSGRTVFRGGGLGNRLGVASPAPCPPFQLHALNDSLDRLESSGGGELVVMCNPESLSSSLTVSKLGSASGVGGRDERFGTEPRRSPGIRRGLASGAGLDQLDP